MSGIPSEIADDFVRARRLEWWTLGWMVSVVAVMYLALGGSQAMRAALIEDVLSLIPAVAWLIASRFEPRGPTDKYPFGIVRVNSLAFLVSAVALTVVGSFVFYESAHALIAGDHPTVPPVTLFGREIWMGWVMIAALAYSVVVPMALGHKKLPVARALHDEVLHTDALMQKADWQTGVAGILGIVGIGLGIGGPTARRRCSSPSRSCGMVSAIFAPPPPNCSTARRANSKGRKSPKTRCGCANGWRRAFPARKSACANRAAIFSPASKGSRCPPIFRFRAN